MRTTQKHSKRVLDAIKPVPRSTPKPPDWLGQRIYCNVCERFQKLRAEDVTDCDTLREFRVDCDNCGAEMHYVYYSPLTMLSATSPVDHGGNLQEVLNMDGTRIERTAKLAYPPKEWRRT